MGNILFLPHRLPYPPNKGDKVRSYHMLKYLAAQHRVWVGTFVDDPEDERYVEDVRALCHDLHVERLCPRSARLRSLTGLLTGEALTLPYYRNAAMARWVGQTIREQGITQVVVFSSAMAQFVETSAVPLLVDFVDLDSDKWIQYADRTRWPMSWVYRREGRKLLEFERRVARKALASFFVTDAEVMLFRRLAGGDADRVEAIANGVDADYFSPAFSFACPYDQGEWPVVFTGAMDYWPNVDAVTWFAAEVLPRLLAGNPAIRFYIVGMRPAPAVLALAGPHVVVTGGVADVRPYLAGAKLVVAPLRIARGIQNKVLEAMAMEKAVVVAANCAEPIEAEPGVHFETAASTDEYVMHIESLLAAPERAAVMGKAARERVVARYGWRANLAPLEKYLHPTGNRPSMG